MMELTLECAPEDRDELYDLLLNISSDDIDEGTVKGLDGSAETIMLIAQVAATALAGFGPIVAAFISRRRPLSKIRIEADGLSLEVEDATPERAAQLWRELEEEVRKRASK